MQEITELYAPAAHAQGLNLLCDTQVAWVNGHRQLLTQLLANLIENAVTYAGSDALIRLRVRAEPNGVRLEVADNGPGIPVEDRERALRPFVRLSRSTSAGSGLGLSLVAAIARLHEARLTLEIANTVILPAALRYQTELATNLASLKAIDVKFDSTTLDEVSEAIKTLRESIAALRAEVSQLRGALDALTAEVRDLKSALGA